MVFGSFEIFVLMAFVGLCAHISYVRGQKSFDAERFVTHVLNQLEKDKLIRVDKLTGDVKPYCTCREMLYKNNNL